MRSRLKSDGSSGLNEIMAVCYSIQNMQEGKDAINSEKPEPALVVISKEDFLTPPEGLHPYDSDEPVDRSTFTPWLINSFRLSRGEPIVQFVVWEWTRINRNFDYRASLVNFKAVVDERTTPRLDPIQGKVIYNKDRFDFLSEEERNYLSKAYKQVKAHTQAYATTPPMSQSDILSNIAVQVAILLDNDEISDAKEGYLPPNMTTMQVGYAELVKKTHEHATNIKEEND